MRTFSTGMASSSDRPPSSSRARASRAAATGSFSAHVRGAGFIRQFVEAVGSSRLIFGSLFYSHPASYEHCTTIDEIKAAKISDDDKTNILERNAKRLFRLS